MAVLYDVPSIGKQANDFGQRGPTCWYYAAKMLLKFHMKLDYKGDEIYNELKTLHQVRKVMSESGKKTAATIKAELEGLKAKLQGYSAAIDRLEKKGVLTKQQLESLQFMREASSAEQKQRVDTAIENLDKEINAEMSRLNLLQSFVPTAGFWKVNKEQYEKPKDVLGLLERWGPFYTGGSVVASRKNIKATGKMAGATPILSVKEFETKGSHAIVVIGATDSTVYYKDPQKTDQIRSMDLEAFHKGLDTEAEDFLIAIYCEDGWNTEEAQCEHMMRCRLTLPS